MLDLEQVCDGIFLVLPSGSSLIIDNIFQLHFYLLLGSFDMGFAESNVVSLLLLVDLRLQIALL